ncbi:hypothetical protein ACEQUB_p00180 (plasmid) [Ralstonia syzygii]
MSTVPPADRMAPPRSWGRGHGLVMLTLLIVLMLASIALLAGLDVWALQRQRQQEDELLFVGNQYRQAIERYYLAGRSLPMSIDDLLDDKRFPVPLHHLRRVYPDPITGRNDWELLRDGTGIYGIHSKSDGVPIKHANFSGPIRVLRRRANLRRLAVCLSHARHGPARCCRYVGTAGQADHQARPLLALTQVCPTATVGS